MEKALQNWLQKHHSPKTAAAYQREIQAYLQNHPSVDGHGPPPEKARHEDIVHYIGSLRKRYNNPSTLNRILCSIKAYYDYLHHTGKRKDHPARSIRLRDPQNRDIQLQDLFTPEELENLLERKERFNLLTWRNKVLMSLLVYQALKPNETENLTTADINLEQGSIHTQGSRKTNARRLQLKPMQIMLFHQYLQEVRPQLLKGHVGAEGGNPDRSIGKSDKLLIGARGRPMPAEDITKHIKRSYKNRYPGRNVNAMSIRQSVITNLLKAGNDLRMVQEFAGHKYPSTTERYKQSNDELLRQAIEQHHPMH